MADIAVQKASILQLALSGNTKQMVLQAEDAWLLAVSASEDDKVTLVVPLVLGYLILNDLPPAKFALARTSLTPRHHSLFQALYELLASTQARKHERVYSRAAQLLSLVEAPGFFSQDLAAAVKTLVASFLKSFRSLAIYLLGESYRSLAVGQATRVLGLSEAEVSSTLRDLGWTINASDKTLAPPTAHVITAETGKVSSFDALERLSKSTTILELS